MMKAVKKVRFAPVCVSLMVISLMVAGISYAKIDLETCVGVWLFDEGKGNVASDSCENGSNGKIHGGAKWVNGKLGGKALHCIRDDGREDAIHVVIRQGLASVVELLASKVGGTKIGARVAVDLQIERFHLSEAAAVSKNSRQFGWF